MTSISKLKALALTANIPMKPGDDTTHKAISVAILWEHCDLASILALLEALETASEGINKAYVTLFESTKACQRFVPGSEAHTLQAGMDKASSVLRYTMEDISKLLEETT